VQTPRPGSRAPDTLGPCLHSLVEARARLQPEALALSDGSRTLAYAQLDRDANRVAHGLLARGVAPEERVGVLAERSLEYVVAILGVLKAGAAYLPLDPHQPDERIEYVRRDGGARVVLAQRRLADRVSGGIVAIEVGGGAGELAPPAPARGAANGLAYVIYTSGSTGRPKGVMIEHRSVVNLVQFYRDTFALDEHDRLSQIQRPGFDGCVAEIWPALAWGASLHIPDEKTAMRPARLMQWLDREAITICDVPTVVAEALFDEEPPATLQLRALMTGGDKLRRRPPARFPCPVYDQYGPTENTVATTFARVDPEGSGEGPLHIGRPVANHRVHLLGAALEPVPSGEVGELYLAGAGLARGYLGDPALDAERFLPDPFDPQPGARMYRTGDLARLLPDGNLEYLGRVDDQVKIRGFRVELGEIERRLAEHPAVVDALVQALPAPGGGKRVVAHYRTGAAGTPTRQELRAFLNERLPNYMLPTQLVRVLDWPTTPNGKVDRRALAASLDGDPGGRELAPPRNDVDARLVEIWQTELGVRPIGIADDFFELGGQSLIAAAVAARVERELAVDLPLALFFQAPTIAEISDHVRGERAIVTEPGLVPLTTRGSRPPLFLLPGVGGHVIAFRDLALALGDPPCFGLQDPALEGRRDPCRSVEELAETFLELVRTVDPHGPYRLLGYSLGGLVAYEMAQKLRRQGAPAAFVGLLDTPAPGYPPKPPLPARLATHAGNLARLTPGERRAYLKERWGNLRQRLRSGAQRQTDYEHEIASLVTPRMREVLAAHRLAAERYRVAPYPGPITLFRAAEHPDWPATSFDDPRMGWAGFVSGEIEVREVPGAHLEVLDPSHATALAAQLEAALARNEREPRAGSGDADSRAG
jgi:amino acid adenylation domain-containing protein